MRGVAVGVGVARRDLWGNVSDVDYSAERVAELSERDVWVGLQEWLIDSFMLPIFVDWLMSGMLRGEIVFEKSGRPVPDILQKEIINSAEFRGRRWGWVDPLKEAKAATEMINSGQASRTELAAARGREFDDVANELGQEAKVLAEAGVETDKSPPQNTTKEDDDNV